MAAAGHTVGAHTWSHANLNSKKMTEQLAKDEIEKGYSAVKLALGAAPSPFFRFPQLQHGPAAMAYLGSRNIAMFSCDLDSFDFRSKDAAQIVNTVMTKLDKQGKGIILMHDFQKHTAEALPTLLQRLKAGGYKVVQMKAKAPLQTLAEYDEALVKDHEAAGRQHASRWQRGADGFAVGRDRHCGVVQRVRAKRGPMTGPDPNPDDDKPQRPGFSQALRQEPDP